MFDDHVQLESWEPDEVIKRCITEDIQVLIDLEEQRHRAITHLLDGLEAYKALLDQQAKDAGERWVKSLGRPF